MREEWEKYLLSKVELKGYQGRHKGAKKKAKEPKGFGILDGVVPKTVKEDGEASSSINKQENDALLAAASAIRNSSKKETAVADPCQLVGNEINAPRKRNKKGKKCSQEEENLEKKNKASSSANEGEGPVDKSVTEDGPADGKQRNLFSVNGVLRRHKEEFCPNASTNRRPLPPVHFHALESDLSILEILKPSVIIIYHPDITFVREVEVYNANNPSKRVKVYFLFYEDSTEVQKFEASIRRENGAFESLIRQKSMMMIPINLVCFFLLAIITLLF